MLTYLYDDTIISLNCQFYVNKIEAAKNSFSLPLMHSFYFLIRGCLVLPSPSLSFPLLPSPSLSFHPHFLSSLFPHFHSPFILRFPFRSLFSLPYPVFFPLSFFSTHPPCYFLFPVPLSPFSPPCPFCRGLSFFFIFGFWFLDRVGIFFFLTFA